MEFFSYGVVFMKKSAKKGAGAMAVSQKTVGGVAVEPCLYKGNGVGHGTFMAAKFENGALVMDKDGKPVPYKKLVNS